MVMPRALSIIVFGLTLLTVNVYSSSEPILTNTKIEPTVNAIFGRITPLHGKTKPLPKERYYEVNLDEPAEHRWSKIIINYEDELSVLESFLRAKFPGLLFQLAERVMTLVDGILPIGILQEIQGLAKATNRDVGLFLLLNLFYELNSGCTSIVASAPDGSIVHGRNLDYSVPGLADITADVKFTKGGKLVFRSTTYVGYTGIVTGLVPGAFSISMDQRRYSATPMEGLLKNALEALLAKGSLPVGMHIRSVLETETTYLGALEALQITKEISTSYLILGGTSGSEGAIITRDRQNVKNVRTLDVDAGVWYVLETNYDWWTAVPKIDDRRTPAIQHMEALTRGNLTLSAMESQVMAVFPTLNGGTTYTTVMSATTGEVVTWLRNIEE